MNGLRREDLDPGTADLLELVAERLGLGSGQGFFDAAFMHGKLRFVRPQHRWDRAELERRDREPPSS